MYTPSIGVVVQRKKSGGTLINSYSACIEATKMRINRLNNTVGGNGIKVGSK